MTQKKKGVRRRKKAKAVAAKAEPAKRKYAGKRPLDELIAAAQGNLRRLQMQKTRRELAHDPAVAACGRALKVLEAAVEKCVEVEAKRLAHKLVDAHRGLAEELVKAGWPVVKATRPAGRVPDEHIPVSA